MTDEQDRTTDENDPLAPPVAASSADVPPGGAEPEPIPTPPLSASAAAATAPVATGPTASSASEEDEDDESEEPLGATRSSPHAIAAIGTALLGLFQAPQQIFTAQGLIPGQFARYILPTLAVPIAAAIISLWLAFKADEEIFMSDGRLGGVGFSRAAKVISAVVLIVALSAIVLVLFFSEQPQQPQFG